MQQQKMAVFVLAKPVSPAKEEKEVHSLIPRPRLSLTQDASYRCVQYIYIFF